MTQHVHGQFAIRSVGQVLFARPIGRWNVDCAFAYNAAFAHTLATISLKYETFLGIADMRFWYLGTPDALEIVHQLPGITDMSPIRKIGDVYFGGTGVPTKISKKTFIPNAPNFWQIQEISELKEVIDISGVETDFDELSGLILDESSSLHPLSPTY